MLRYLLVLMLLAGCATAEPAMPPDIESGLTAEAKAYSAMLQSKVERGEMSFEEAQYLYARKVNELTDRAAAATPSTQPRQQVTTCRPDTYGAVRCTTR